MSNRNCTPEDVRKGQAVYSRRVLALYDWFVLGLSNRFIWKCPTARLLDLYRSNITTNHLEIGVGTGYYLDQCLAANPAPRLVLLDLNQNCLEVAATRVKRYSPTTVRANVLETLPPLGEPFNSVGINYVLHCLPGNLKSKACMFDHLLPWIKPGGVVFGSTICGSGTKLGFLARRLMSLYNAKGIFCNRADNLDDLQLVLEQRFDAVSVKTVGCVALFVAFRS